ncbi:hypothetical protein M8J75_006867 [Diaphorina citri]|nr:hypothetical protein M8J75_006867 [Diaphorina citri]
MSNVPKSPNLNSPTVNLNSPTVNLNSPSVNWQSPTSNWLTFPNLNSPTANSQTFTNLNSPTPTKSVSSESILPCPHYRSGLPLFATNHQIPAVNPLHPALQNVSSPSFVQDWFKSQQGIRLSAAHLASLQNAKISGLSSNVVLVPSLPSTSCGTTPFLPPGTVRGIPVLQAPPMPALSQPWPTSQLWPLLSQTPSEISTYLQPLASFGTTGPASATARGYLSPFQPSLGSYFLQPPAKPVALDPILRRQDTVSMTCFPQFTVPPPRFPQMVPSGLPQFTVPPPRFARPENQPHNVDNGQQTNESYGRSKMGALNSVTTAHDRNASSTEKLPVKDVQNDRKPDHLKTNFGVKRSYDQANREVTTRTQKVEQEDDKSNISRSVHYEQTTHPCSKKSRTWVKSPSTFSDVKSNFSDTTSFEISNPPPSSVNGTPKRSCEEAFPENASAKVASSMSGHKSKAPKEPIPFYPCTSTKVANSMSSPKSNDSKEVPFYSGGSVKKENNGVTTGSFSHVYKWHRRY